MFITKQLLFLLFASLSETTFIQNAARTALPTGRSRGESIKQIVNTNSTVGQIKKDKTSTILPEEPIISDTTADEIKNEIFVNDLLETAGEPAVVDIPDPHYGPHYELDWAFIDKDTIRVVFDLYSVPTSLIENIKYPETIDHKQNILATMVSMSSHSLKTIYSLEYFLFIIRPYNKNKEIILKLEKLSTKNTTTRKYNHFSNSLRLTALNHEEKYSVCICYYQTNISTKTPDLLLCQDIINDYSKFSHLRADPRHGLLFITTQYSIIFVLLLVLQTVFTIRKRRIAQIIGHHLSSKAHSIRTTLSSASLVRQSFSSLDTAGEQQHHATNSHAINRVPTADGVGGGMKKRIISSPAIVISEPFIPLNNGATSSDETEPFLKLVSSKNHVHFLLGPGEGSDEEDGEHENEDITVSPQTASALREPYGDEPDALLSMAHILDTNKPWSRHSQHPSPV